MLYYYGSILGKIDTQFLRLLIKKLKSKAKVGIDAIEGCQYL